MKQNNIETATKFLIKEIGTNDNLGYELFQKQNIPQLMVEYHNFISAPSSTGTKEEILINCFNDYGNFGSIDDVKYELGKNKDYVLQIILNAMDTYAAAQNEAIMKELDEERNELKKLIAVIREKADSWSNATKETRARKGAYVDCLVMFEEFLTPQE